MAACSAASTPEQETALREYGFNLGIAFQLVDDLLDYTADAAALGKPVGGDLREGKVTLPIILLLRRGGADADGLIRDVVRDRTVAPEQWRDILRLLHEHRSTELAYETALDYAARAKSCLSAFPPSQERDALIGAARLRGVARSLSAFRLKAEPRVCDSPAVRCGFRP